jgi:hypothetical protein
MGRYRYVGDHPETLEHGQPIEPGEFVELDDVSGTQNRMLIDDGKLVAIEEESEPKKATKKEAEA